MAIYTYRAADHRHLAQCGTIAADTPRQAREVLRGRGLKIHALEEGAVKTALGRRRWASKGRFTHLVMTSLREVVTLLSAGIPLLEAWNTVTQQQRGAFRTAFMVVHERVAAGLNLAEAMAEQPEIFDPLCIHMVEVGENAGTLETVLEEWVDFKERAMALKDRVLTALMYPAFVFVVGLGVTVFLMTYVIPMLLANLVDSGQDLPWPTKMVKGLSDLLTEHSFVLLAVAGGLVIGVLVMLRMPQGKRFSQGLFLKIPLLGPMIRKQAIARTVMVIATLMKSGIEFVKAVEVTARSAGNLWLRDALLQCTKAVSAGQDIGVAFGHTGFFPPMVAQIFAVGQESGRMEEMLERLAKDYDRQVARTADRLTAILEPVLILSLAVFVGFLLLATILPILDAGKVM